MHIYFSGIGGAGIGPLAQVAKQAGYEVSGSDKRDSDYIKYLKSKGIENIHIGQTAEQIAAVHDKRPIDWFVYSSALPLENPNAPELKFCEEQKIKTSKRDELLNQILHDKKLKLVAIAGTHGKTTTTAMVVWLFKQLKVPASYILPAKTSFGDMGEFDAGSQFFIYEADEFDRNFLAFEPFLSLITGVSWDHHEIFKTREEYQEAFLDFIKQSAHTVIWQEDYEYLEVEAPTNLSVLDSSNKVIDVLMLKGRSNRLDAWAAIQGVHRLTKKPLPELIKIMNNFPGLQRRMEQIVPGLYSDYAHTPDKIRGAMEVALETAGSKPLVVVYEPLTNRRQHFIKNEYGSVFNGASKIYWVPSYLAREDPAQKVLSPADLINHLDDPSIAEPAELNAKLKENIEKHLRAGDMVVAMSGGGGESLDDWLRKEF